MDGFVKTEVGDVGLEVLAGLTGLEEGDHVPLCESEVLFSLAVTLVVEVECFRPMLLVFVDHDVLVYVRFLIDHMATLEEFDVDPVSGDICCIAVSVDQRISRGLAHQNLTKVAEEVPIAQIPDEHLIVVPIQRVPRLLGILVLLDPYDEQVGVDLFQFFLQFGGVQPRKDQDGDILEIEFFLELVKTHVLLQPILLFEDDVQVVRADVQVDNQHLEQAPFV